MSPSSLPPPALLGLRGLGTGGASRVAVPRGCRAAGALARWHAVCKEQKAPCPELRLEVVSVGLCLAWRWMQAAAHSASSREAQGVGLAAGPQCWLWTSPGLDHVDLPPDPALPIACMAWCWFFERNTMDVCAKRHHCGGGLFAQVLLLLVAKLGCSVSITPMWEVSWGSAEPLLSGKSAWLSEGCSATCLCLAPLPEHCGWKQAGGTIALLEGMEEAWPLCPRERAQPVGTLAGHWAASAPGSWICVSLGHGKSVGEADVGLQTFVPRGDLLVPSFAGTSWEPLPGQSTLVNPASCQVSACSWQSWQLPLAQSFSVRFGLVRSKAVWAGVCCRMPLTAEQHGCVVPAAAAWWLLRGLGGEVPTPERTLYLAEVRLREGVWIVWTHFSPVSFNLQGRRERQKQKTLPVCSEGCCGCQHRCHELRSLCSSCSEGWDGFRHTSLPCSPRAELRWPTPPPGLTVLDVWPENCQGRPESKANRPESTWEALRAAWARERAAAAPWGCGARQETWLSGAGWLHRRKKRVLAWKKLSSFQGLLACFNVWGHLARLLYGVGDSDSHFCDAWLPPVFFCSPSGWLIALQAGAQSPTGHPPGSSIAIPFLG